MAYWGIAMTWYHPIWAPPNAQELAAGAAAANKSRSAFREDRARARLHRRDRRFLSRLRRLDHQAARRRVQRTRWSSSRAQFPTTTKRGSSTRCRCSARRRRTTRRFANQKKAAAILNALLPLEPQHPGIAHYMIHSFDYPQLAADALPAARAYSKIAPDSPHALHMPSHIFTRLGLWQDSIASNLASAEAGRQLVAQRHPGAASMDTLHALDYLEYAYLQIGDEAAARQVLAEAAAAKTFDDPTFAGRLRAGGDPRALRFGAARLEGRGATRAARRDAAVGELSLRARDHVLRASDRRVARPATSTARGRRWPSSRRSTPACRSRPSPAPTTGRTRSSRHALAAAAWLAYAEGRKDEAVQMARAAAELEEATGKHPVTPGAPLPARELLGDMLLEMERPAEALAAYEASLHESPNRFNSLYGAARAAELSKDNERARELYAALLDQCVANSQRPELAQARKFIGD